VPTNLFAHEYWIPMYLDALASRAYIEFLKRRLMVENAA
jgi:hypothetical protein